MKLTQNWRGRAQSVALAAVAVALVSAGVAAGQPDQNARAPRMRGPMPFAHLNLTDDQQARLKTIVEEQREANQAKGQALRAAHEELRKAIFASATPDAGQIEALTTRAAELEAEVLRARVATEMKIAAILTDEQRQQMAAATPRRGRGPGRGPGPGR